MLKRTLLYLCFVCWLAQPSRAQAPKGFVLHPGFDASEYLYAMRVSCAQVSIKLEGERTIFTEFNRLYSSPKLAWGNKWDIWTDKANTLAVISIRGTMPSSESWLENLYSSMIPAKGEIKSTDNQVFAYQLAQNPDAMVHVGWTIGLSHMAPAIMDSIRSVYAKGIKQIIVTGHSQGGAIACLLASYIHYQQVNQKLPKDIVLKTYAGAAPKPGNVQFAYDYALWNQAGWAFNVISPIDWIPETPYSVQGLQDINSNSPFLNIKPALQGQKFYLRWGALYIRHRLSKATTKARRRYDHFMGKKIYKRLKKFTPTLVQPKYTKSIHYVQAGTPIMLQPDSSYYAHFPDTGKMDYFKHHFFQSYHYLLKHNYSESLKK